MTNYTKSTNFATKDALSSGNPLKIVKGTEIDTEFNNIQTAIATKADSGSVGTVTSVGGTGTVNGITLTGTVTSSGNLTLGGTLANVNLASQVTGTLPLANGGTAATTAANARTNLGALAASNPSYTGTLTGGTGVINIGSGQLGKDADGNLLVGTTAATLSTNTFTVAAAKPALVLGNSTTANSSPALSCIKAGSTASTSQIYVSFNYNSGSNGNGQIAGNGDSQATFVTSSDARLKENVVNLPSQLSNILALRPVEFDYKASKGHQVGFIAQEVQEIYPDLISEGDDGYLSLAGLDKNAARLIKAIQELKALVDAQAVRIAALESQ